MQTRKKMTSYQVNKMLRKETSNLRLRIGKKIWRISRNCRRSLRSKNKSRRRSMVIKMSQKMQMNRKTLLRRSLSLKVQLTQLEKPKKIKRKKNL